jgi:CheY-like chemotaxis protein
MTKKNKYIYDVFISYSHQNKNWVHTVLLRRLEKASLKVFIDFRDFKAGAPSLKEMERGVIKSRKTLIVLTPEYVKSGWTEFEMLMTQTLSPANRDLRIIPVLKKKCSLPVSIRYMNYVDLSNQRNNESEWLRLMGALERSPAAPKVLVVDDQPDVRTTIAGCLEDVKYEVFVASDEDAALHILQQQKINFAIIDIKLHNHPGDESGLKLANAIHALASHIQIVILSGSTKPKHIVSAFKDFGVVDYIVKTDGWEERLLRSLKD